MSDFSFKCSGNSWRSSLPGQARQVAMMIAVWIYFLQAAYLIKACVSVDRAASSDGRRLWRRIGYASYSSSRGALGGSWPCNAAPIAVAAYRWRMRPSSNSLAASRECSIGCPCLRLGQALPAHSLFCGLCRSERSRWYVGRH